MRDIAADMLAQYRSNELTTIWLFEFEVSDTWYRYNSMDVPFYFDGTLSGTTISGNFLPLGFQFEEILYTMNQVVDSATITVDNLDSVMTALFVGSTVQDGDAKLYGGVITSSGTILGIVEVFEGKIDSFDIDETELRLVVASPFAQWSSTSYGLHSSSCRWKVFTGTECAYAGGENWCDRSYTRCTALGNTANFGGFRYLPDLQNKTIWWGPVPSEL